MMTPAARQGLLDDMENFVRQQFGNQVTRPIVVTLTTAKAAVPGLPRLARKFRLSRK